MVECIFFFTNAIFSELGAEDIVSRYDELFHEWKLLKDAEQGFKGVMGLDHDRPLVKCLDSIPPGNQCLCLFFHTNSGGLTLGAGKFFVYLSSDFCFTFCYQMCALLQHS